MPTAINNKEQTTSQVFLSPSYEGLLSKGVNQSSKWAAKVRLMRADPNVAFLRDLYAAPILAADWAVEATDGDLSDPVLKQAADFLYGQFSRNRLHILEHTINGLVDFGWQPFERIFDVVETPAGPMIGIRKVKPLLQDFTDILVDENGALIGVRNRPVDTRKKNTPSYIDLDLSEILLFNRGVEGTNWYGEAIMKRVEGPYDRWYSTDTAHERYLTKLAGAHWVVHYPLGSSRLNGTETDNSTIAKAILNSLEASGKVAIPTKIAAFVDDLSNTANMPDAWEIELISASGTPAADFTDRKKHMETLICRAFDIPERAITEGQYGTKAESESQADFAISLSEMLHRRLTANLNENMTNPLLDINYGASMVDALQLVPAPLSDDKRQTLHDVYMTLLASPDGALEEFDRIDREAMRDKLGIPTRVPDEVPVLTGNEFV